MQGRDVGSSGSNSLIDLIGAGIPFIAGSILIVGGLITLKINEMRIGDIPNRYGKDGGQIA